jgi:PhnB protein
MAPTDSSSFTPAGWHVVAPRIVVHGAQQLVAFVNHVFGAAGSYLPDRPSVLNIGGSRVMISDAGICPPMPAFLYVYVADADSTYRRAIEAGATSLEAPWDVPYGERRGMVEDAWGNVWQIATWTGSRVRPQG